MFIFKSNNRKRKNYRQTHPAHLGFSKLSQKSRRPNITGSSYPTDNIRLVIVYGVLLLAFISILARIFQLAVTNRAFLVQQSNARILRTVTVLGRRGNILDRNGVFLAVSAPIDSVWVNPTLFNPSRKQIRALDRLLGMPIKTLNQHIKQHRHRSFIYLKRDVRPDTVEMIRHLHIAGLFFKREYHRFYPEGRMTTHILGLTDVDDHGQEGIELAYDHWLRGMPGKKLIAKDRLGHIIGDLHTLKTSQKGQDLRLSIDKRMQYLAYRELQSAVEKAHAKAGSVIILDARTSEILAMANWPACNPNQLPRAGIKSGCYRNRAVTDVFEPGSTMKAFSIALSIANHQVTPQTLIDTNPGWLTIDGNRIIDESINHGVISVRQVLQKSSNVGTAKIALQLSAKDMVGFLSSIGLGRRTAIEFPGEARGVLPNRQHWRPFELATLSFGYGLSVTALQLTQAYSVLASGGMMRPVTLLYRPKPPPGKRVIEASAASTMLQMLASVVDKGGTGYRARVPGYQVAGKTGTAYMTGSHGYDKKRYIASFVGIAPVKHPQFVVTVVIWEPDPQYHYGGLIAAPVFSNIVSSIL